MTEVERALEPVLVALRLGGPRSSVSLVRGPASEIADVQRTLMDLDPGLVSIPDVLELPGVPAGSLVLSGLDREGAIWLNQWRSAIQSARLRLVLWASDAVDLNLRRDAPDLDSWVSHVVLLPPAIPSWTVRRLREAPAGRIAWTGQDLNAALAAAWPGREIVAARTAPDPEPLAEMARVLSSLLVVEDVQGVLEFRRLKWSLALAGRAGDVVLARPGLACPGFAVVHDQPQDWSEATERLRAVGISQPVRVAAALALDPEAIAAVVCAQEEEAPAKTVDEMPWELAVLSGQPSPAEVLEAARKEDGAVAAMTALLRWPELVGALDEMVQELVMLWAEGGETCAALLLAGQSVRHRERAFGTGTPEALAAMNNLANVLEAKGDLTEARELLEHVLLERTRILGTTHPDTLTTSMNLANVLLAQGERAEALLLMEGVHDACSQTLGAVSRETQLVEHNLAHHRMLAGDLEGARSLAEKVVRIYIEQLGPDHPDSVLAATNLAIVQRKQGRLADANDTMEGVVRALRDSRGSVHPGALAALESLANLKLEQGEFIEAQRLQEQVIDLSRRMLGPDHRWTLGVEANFAETLRMLGDIPQALELARHALECRGATLGSEHPDTLRSLGQVADLAAELGHLTEALELQRHVLEARSRLLGSEHPDSLSSAARVAGLQLRLGDLSSARSALEKVLEVRVARLGPDHPDTLNVSMNLAVELGLQGDLQGARDRLRAVLVARTRILGSRHPETVLTAWNLFQAQRKLADPSAAETLEGLLWLLNVEHDYLSAQQRQIRDQLLPLLAEYGIDLPQPQPTSTSIVTP